MAPEGPRGAQGMPRDGPRRQNSTAGPPRETKKRPPGGPQGRLKIDAFCVDAQSVLKTFPWAPRGRLWGGRLADYTIKHKGF